jgi:iron complex outermembrane receptor protein
MNVKGVICELCFASCVQSSRRFIMSSIKTWSLVFICVLIYFCADPSKALSADSLNNSVVLAPITISASRNQTLVQDMPVHTTILTREEIQSSPFQSLDEFLKTLPGFNFSGAPSYMSDPTGNQTKIRGLGNAKVLVLVDGIPMVDPFYLTTQWFRVPMSNIERVEIIRGGSSSLWGSMAVGGVVNVITQTPKVNSSEMSISYGSNHTSNLAFNQNLIVSDTLRLNAEVNQFQTHGYQVTPSQYLYMYPGKLAPTDTSDGYQLSAFFTPHALSKGFLRLNYFTQSQDLYGVYGQNVQKTPNVSSGLTQELEGGASLDQKAWFQHVSFNKTNGSACYLVNSSSCLNGGSSTPPALTQTGAPVVNYFTQYGDQAYLERGVSSVYSKPISNLIKDVQIGFDVRQLAVEDSEQYYGYPSAGSSQNLTGTAQGQGTQTFSGAFIQSKLIPKESMIWTLSARLDHWSNTHRSDSLTTTSHGLSPGSGPVADLTKSQFNPSIGVHQDLSDEVALRGAAYRAFRAPGLNNQTRSYGATIANPNLIAETLTGWELGVDVKTLNSQLSATYFSSRISNMIAASTYTMANALPQQVINLCSTAPLGSSPNLLNCGSSVSFYSNDQNGRSSGLELSEKWRINSKLTLDALYTLTDTVLTSTWNGVTTPTNTQLAGIAKNAASLAATWYPEHRVRVWGQLNYLGALSYYQSSSLNAMQGPNVVVNASLSWSVDPQTTVFANVINVLNRQYQDGTYTASSPQAQTLASPRSIALGLRCLF